MIQGLALAFGPLTLVQPLAAADVLFALPMIAVLRRYRLTRGDWIGAFAVAGGLAVFLAVAPPAGGEPARVPRAWAPVLLAATAVTAVSVAAAARTRGVARVAVLAAGAGVTFGVLDALAKSSVDLLTDRGPAVLRRWEPYGLLVTAPLGAFLSQAAFRAGPLSVSLPVIDTLEPVSAVVIAATVFGEELAASAAQITAQTAAAMAAVAGIAVLSRSSVAAAETRPTEIAHQ